MASAAADCAPLSGSGTTPTTEISPNPFNATTAISYQLSAVSRVWLSVHDLLGREITTLVETIEQPGTYRVAWDARDVASGVYLCRLVATPATGNGLVQVRKMIVMK